MSGLFSETRVGRYKRARILFGAMVLLCIAMSWFGEVAHSKRGILNLFLWLNLTAYLLAGLMKPEDDA